ncbi:MAG: UDP-4-amino-4,6-dideoxy-N-acetyl-beta-L-altrosamine transaminase [Rhodopseudomonas sp.]|nr:UDP-4-amino-4,6-dideoxy-N-acetyl-beta-L-altrosamine transaminase [Rhodopseudomonas sp.]
MTSPFLGYGRQTVAQDDIDAVVAVLRGDYLTQGPLVDRFEQALAERVGAAYAVAVSNGTAGLHLACLAADFGPGQRGLTSALTFVASANCFYYCGGEAGVVDVDAETLCLSPAALAQSLADGDNVTAIVPVDFGGLAAGNAELRTAAGKRVIIEDACHAFGGDYADGAPVGSGKHADMTVFSFHPVKPITTGEGGAITTNDPEFARRLRLLRSHGIEREPTRLQDKGPASGEPRPWHYEQQSLGYNYRLTDMQAALGLTQLSKLDGFLARRREIAAYYDAQLTKLPGLQVPQSAPDMRRRSGMHLYLIQVDWPRFGTTRGRVMEALRGRGIGTQVHYIPVYRQPYHAHRMAVRPALFPNAERYFDECLSIPLFPSMTDTDAERVVAVLREVLGA